MAHSSGMAAQSFRESAAVLALFAMVLSLLAGLMPMTGAFGMDRASLCRPDGGPADGGTPGLPGHDHDELCCLAPPPNASAVISSPGPVAAPYAVAIVAHRIADELAVALRRHVHSQPRAPPSAA